MFWEGRPSSMSPERIRELEAEGFMWEIRKTTPSKTCGVDAAEEYDGDGSALVGNAVFEL